MKDLFGLNIANLLVLIGLAAVSALAYVVTQNTKISNTVAGFSSLVGNIRFMYNNTGNNATLTNAVILNGNDIAPVEMIIGGALVNQWGNPITVTPGNAFAGYNVAQVAISTIVPQNACAKVLTSLKTTAVQVTGAAWRPAPIDPATITADCAAFPSTAINLIFN